MRSIGALQSIGKFATKHPDVYSGTIGAINGATTGALVGGIVGGIREDDTFLNGAGKGALIGTGIGTVVNIPRMRHIAKSGGKTTSELYQNAFNDLFKGLGHDGIGI